MAQQVPLSSSARADNPRQDDARDDGLHQVTPDLAYQRLAIVNAAYVETGSGGWVLIDAGVPGAAGLITSAVEKRYGPDSRPAAIVLTHGHFDHVGALEELSERWDVPVWAHELERPYLDGTSSYPPPDPTVGGGMMAWSAKLYPRGPANVGSRLQILPADGSVPPLPGWRWIHTPGHTPGHISLWRESDRSLIAGDAFITTNQESAYAVAVQKPEMHAPPTYYTQDWQASKRSVEKLAELEPELVITGHGRAMQGQEMRRALHTLARDFDDVAVPKEGRYVADPARPEDGSAYAPA